MLPKTCISSIQTNQCFSGAVIFAVILTYGAWFLPTASGQVDSVPSPQKPVIEPASGEGQDAISQFKYPDNLKCELFAAEPDVANIVAFHRDYQGNVFVCETFRQGKGVEDNRNHAHWMDEELAAQTVQDRIDYVLKYIPNAAEKYTANDDRIRLLRDTNNNGKPDSISIFSDRYNKLEMGTGAGVLSYRGKVYYTCIPDLFELQDIDNDGVAENRKSLHTGFGVRYAFRGHDLHGLIIGPDGRLYFSIGDRGYNVSPTIKDPASGAVFRCELDGSDLEVVATGFRNPQELAFDNFGNLFTGDNNSDSGDQARWTEVVRGGDTGWRMYYQYQPDRGPFNREKIWHPFNEDTPAYIIPPIKNFTDGPSGLEFYPGTGFGEDFKDRFFLCDFRGDASLSGVRSFRNRAKGAHWELVDDEQPFWNMLITDLDFGSDGRMYVSDWVFGWKGENKGRMYAFSDPQQQNSAIVKQVESLLRSGLKDQKTDTLKELMGHEDRRIRMEAQFELVDRKDVLTLKSIARDQDHEPLARIHSLWGLGQLGRQARKNNRSFDATFLNHLLRDRDDEVAGIAAGVAPDLGYQDSDALAELLTHKNLRVRFRASMSLGKIGSDKNVADVVEMIAENNDQDPILRHGGIMALNGIFVRNQSPDLSPVAKLGAHASRSVRIALCVAMRKVLLSNANGIYKHRQLATKIVGKMLNDSDPQIVLESARVIHDVDVKPQMSALANMIDRIDQYADSDALVRRIISANVRVGVQANAIALSKFAANEKFDVARRVDAIEALGRWTAPLARDMVLHDWRPLNARSRNVMDARNAVESNFVALASGPEALTSAAITAAGSLNLTSIGSDLEKVALADSGHAAPRVAALRNLAKLKYKGLDFVLAKLETGFDSLPAELVGPLIELISVDDEIRAINLIEQTIASGEQVAQQAALATLSGMKSDSAADLLASCLRKMNADDFPENLRLDVALAAMKRNEVEVKNEYETYVNQMVQAEDPASSFRDTILGGDEAKGSTVFFGKTEVSCVRCHRVDGTGGQVGPDLSSVGLTRDRQYLLEAIVHPNKIVTEGYTQVKIMTDEGELFVGIVKRETDDSVVLLDADGNEIVIEQVAIDARKPGKSSMPDDLSKHLTKKEIRDLVEFLANRKTEPVVKSDHE